ncbi:hypothetical protein PV08_10344 [Exophiala spinifera]|uniref:Zn(2)-C6 fungal-type domain-containing protein n=1 Tax=Exophiala spinifera TaxID=91928 RepID=A0A0D2AXB8_9EURO|nr:uncharacterized protein PV08_10344 [Exophiala spinifera]KIW11045.1 hypothetical protein PV08_10344 [Exophiala spinifera]
MEQRSVVIRRVRRKQHSSCDQCRKAKRACDASQTVGTVPVDGRKQQSPYAKSATSEERLQVPTAKCSNCRKSGRDCTFSWLQDILPPKATDGGKKKHQHRPTAHVPREQVMFQTNTPHLANTSDTRRSPARSKLDQHIQAWDFSPIANEAVDHCWLEALGDAPQERVCIGQEESSTGFQELGSCKPAPEWRIDDISIEHASGGPSPDDGLEFSTLGWTQDTSSFGDTSFAIPQSDGPLFPLTEPCAAPASSAFGTHVSPSILSEDTLISGTNRWLLAQNWLHVYHDSFENALSCWLTERNCPYTLSQKPDSQLHPGNNYFSIWGPQWSNRIYARVCSLDRFLNNMPRKGLNKTDNSLAGKALHAAVMAFGVQWAQAGPRGDMRTYSSSAGSTSNVHEDMNLPAADEFGRSVQETLWYQARQALQNAAGIESYRVAFANIIFSLTQKPLKLEDWVQNWNWKSRVNDAEFGLNGELLSDHRPLPSKADIESRWQILQDIINADGPPVYLEAALRQLVSSRWTWEKRQRRPPLQFKSLPNSRPFNLAQTTDPIPVPTEEHRETFKLLSWLAIMFDTISAAMLQRPVVVSDEDCKIETSDPWRSDHSGDTQKSDGAGQNSVNIFDLDGWAPDSLPDARRDGISSDLWGTLFLEKSKSRTFSCFDQDQLHFSLGEASTILCDAAPVKVLLFRKVGRIQKLMSRRASGEDLELAVDEALGVYAFWNDTYGKFISYCIANHHDLPPRIQSWYIVLAGHWHLGAMLLADAVEEMDQAGLSHMFQRNMRRTSDFSNSLRRSNAITVSELGRCSLHGPSLSFPKAREFSYPVNQVALLSEPWTVVLIQSFSRAGYIFIRYLMSWDQWTDKLWSNEDDERYQLRKRCSYCIEGLLNLANKSDMAFLAAKFLQDCLRNA